MAIVLHQWEVSPYCGKIRHILRLKGLAYETVNYNGLHALRARKLDPAGKLPVLDYDGQRVADSTRIAELLERLHPAPALYPADPRERALAGLWEDWADESLFWFEVYFRVADPDALNAAAALFCAGRPRWERMLIVPALRRDYRARLRAQGLGCLPEPEVDRLFGQHLDRIDASLAGRDWLVGDAITIADIAVQAMLAEIIRTSSRRAQILARPNIQRWLAAAAPEQR